MVFHYYLSLQFAVGSSTIVSTLKSAVDYIFIIVNTYKNTPSSVPKTNLELHISCVLGGVLLHSPVLSGQQSTLFAGMECERWRQRN